MTRKKAAVMAAVMVPLAAAAVPIIRRMRK
jgi:hypothetical protein